MQQTSPRPPERRLVRSTAPARRQVAPPDPPVDPTTARYIAATAAERLEAERAYAREAQRPATAAATVTSAASSGRSRRGEQKLARQRREAKARRHAARQAAQVETAPMIAYLKEVA